MTPEEFAAAMRKIKDDCRGDPELTHSKADDLLLDVLEALGYGEGVKVFNDLDIWYA